MTEDYKDSYLHDRLRERWGGEALAWAEKQRRNKARGIVEHVREELGEQAAGFAMPGINGGIACYD